MAENARKASGGRKRAAKRETVAFDYMKSNYFRVIAVDGIVGGIAPSGSINMAVWNQRKPYPRQVVHAVTEDGEIGEEITRVARETDVVREVEAALVFSPAMARVLIRWLEARLTELAGLEGAEEPASNGSERETK